MLNKAHVGLAKETSLLFFVKIAGALFAFVLQVVINRLVGTTVYGQLSTYLSIGAVAVNILNLGTNTGIVKKAATSETEDEDQKYITYSLYIFIATFIALLLICIISSNKVMSMMDGSIIILLLVLVYSAALSVSNIYTGFFQGKKRTLLANGLDIIVYNILLIGGISITSFFSKNVNSVLFIYVISTIIILIIKAVSISKKTHGTKRIVVSKETILEIRSYSVMCIPFCLSTICTSLQAMILKIVLNSNMGSFDVGVFRILETYVSCMALFVSPFVTMWPYMAEAFKNGKLQELKKTYSLSVAVIALLVVPTTIAMLICNQEVYAIYGLDSKAISGAFMALALMIIAGAVDAIVGPAGALLNMTKYGQINLLITAFSTVLSISLSAFIIPKYGLVGAAIAIALSKILTNVVNAIMNKVLLNVWPYGIRLFLFLICGVPMYIVGRQIYSIIPDTLLVRIISIGTFEVVLSLGIFSCLYRNEIKPIVKKLIRKIKK